MIIIIKKNTLCVQTPPNLATRLCVRTRFFVLFAMERCARGRGVTHYYSKRSGVWLVDGPFECVNKSPPTAPLPSLSGYKVRKEQCRSSVRLLCRFWARARAGKLQGQSWPSKRRRAWALPRWPTLKQGDWWLISAVGFHYSCDEWSSFKPTCFTGRISSDSFFFNLFSLSLAAFMKQRKMGLNDFIQKLATSSYACKQWVFSSLMINKPIQLDK